jgi:hypothetical protein
MLTRKTQGTSAVAKVVSSSCIWVIGLALSMAVSCAPTRPIYTESPTEVRHREQRELQAKPETAWKAYERKKPPYTLYASYDKFDDATT